MEPRRQSGGHHLVSSMSDIGLAFRQTEIRLWARWRRPRTSADWPLISQNWPARKRVLVVVELRCTSELRFAPLLTYIFESQVRGILIGAKRLAWETSRCRILHPRRRAATEMLSARHSAYNLILLVEHVPAEFHCTAGRILLRWGLLDHCRMQPQCVAWSHRLKPA